MAKHLTAIGRAALESKAEVIEIDPITSDYISWADKEGKRYMLKSEQFNAQWQEIV